MRALSYFKLSLMSSVFDSSDTTSEHHFRRNRPHLRENMYWFYSRVLSAGHQHFNEVKFNRIKSYILYLSTFELFQMVWFGYLTIS